MTNQPAIIIHYEILGSIVASNGVQMWSVDNDKLSDTAVLDFSLLDLYLLFYWDVSFVE